MSGRNIDIGLGKQRLRKLYGRVLKSEHKEGMVDVCIDRVQNYDDDEEEEEGDDDTVSDENAEVVSDAPTSAFRPLRCQF